MSYLPGPEDEEVPFLTRPQAYMTGGGVALEITASTAPLFPRIAVEAVRGGGSSGVVAATRGQGPLLWGATDLDLVHDTAQSPATRWISLRRSHYQSESQEGWGQNSPLRHR